MWLDCTLTMFCYFQFLTSDPTRRLGARGDAHSILMHPFFERVDWEAVLQKRVPPPFKPEIRNVSTTASVFIFCHKGMSLNLYVKGECDSLALSVFLWNGITWYLLLVCILLCWRHWHPVEQMLQVKFKFINYVTKKWASILLTYFCCVTVSNMFWPLIWPVIFRVNLLENKNRVTIKVFLNHYPVLKHNYWLKLTVE
jgi:hypothetical protein